jgi:hypothetical protein
MWSILAVGLLTITINVIKKWITNKTVVWK